MNRLRSPFPRDDIPMVILASYELFPLLSQDENLMKIRWEQMVKAIEKEITFEKNGLVSGVKFQDWVDSIHRKGKLSNINILFYQALRGMARMAEHLGKQEEQKYYLSKAKELKEKIMQAFWHEDGFIKAGSQDSRFDTFSNILGTLYLVTPEQAVQIQNNIIKKNMIQNSLLKNFDRPYPQDVISKIVKLGKMEDYHNHYSWPWVTCMNIIAKLKIVSEHSDEKIRQCFKSEALEDFINISQLFNEDKGVYEIVDEETDLPIQRKYNFLFFEVSSYNSSPDFLIAATVYLEVLEKLVELKIVKIENNEIKIFPKK